MKTILHIVSRDKFTVGYIEFMKMCMNQYQHQFLVIKGWFKLEAEDSDGIFFFDSYDDLLWEKQFHKLFLEADAIVISGVFIKWRFFLKLALSPRLLKKTVFHFWGGDFYSYRTDKAKDGTVKQRIKEKIKIAFRVYCFKYCKDIAFLIPGDYSAFCDIFKISRSYSVLKMPGSPRQKRICEYRNSNSHDGTRILLGNSATETNCHEEILRLFHDRFSEEAIEIYCPLSYGEGPYRRSIIQLGKELLGERFIPMTEFIDKEAYIEFLSTCDIGIFNNNRQQGMGNIKYLIGLGKKVYIRSSTSMWNYYKEKGFILFSVEEIQHQSFDEFTSFQPDMRENNMKVADERNPVENSINAWKPFLQKAVSRKTIRTIESVNSL